MERIGRKYRVNLNNLESPNSKALSFLYKERESNKRRNRALGMIRDKLEASTENIMRISPRYD